MNAAAATTRGEKSPQKISRRKSRYGIVKPAPRWRTTEERIEAMKGRAQAEGITVTELTERAVDLYLQKGEDSCTS